MFIVSFLNGESVVKYFYSYLKTITSNICLNSSDQVVNFVWKIFTVLAIFIHELGDGGIRSEIEWIDSAINIQLY